MALRVVTRLTNTIIEKYEYIFIPQTYSRLIYQRKDTMETYNNKCLGQNNQNDKPLLGWTSQQEVKTILFVSL